MDEYKVLITTSGIGNRLGDITKFTNKSLVRVGKKPAISYVVERYPIDIELVITLGYFSNQVRDFLELAYPERKFTFVEIDKYEGPASSLLYSMLCAKDQLQCPFIFHACDTIIEFDYIPEPNGNWLGSYKKTNTDHYRTLNVENNVVTKLNEKGELSYDYEYIGICGIKSYQKFWQQAEIIYNEKMADSSLSDCDVIRALLTEEKFHAIPFNNWLDIGNIGSLKEARKNICDNFELLDKLDESIFIYDDHVIKFFFDTNMVTNRIKRAQHLGNLVPEIIDSKDNFYKYKFVRGKLFSQSANLISFKKFLDWSKEHLWLPVIASEDKFKDICHDFYYKKTVNRIEQFLKTNNIVDKEQMINGINIPAIRTLLDTIDYDVICAGVAVRFHGDYILDNIIETEDGFSLLDWRQDFGGLIEYGDLYYDLGKLNHNLVINHDIVNNNCFKIQNHDDMVECDILRSHKLVQCQEILRKFIKENNLDVQKVEIITALIWLNMSPLHQYPLNQFLFYFGKYNLYKALNGIR